MRQLVGQHCVRCSGEIWSIARGHYCDLCGNPVHTDCVNVESPALIANGRCSACGGDAESDIARNVREERGEPARKREAEAKKEQIAKIRGREAAISNCVKLLIFGVAVSGIGVQLLVREIWQDWGDFGLRTLVPGAGAVVAGTLLIGLSIWLIKRRR